MTPENKNLMYHAILDILKSKYPEPQNKNQEAAKSIILAFEALEDIEDQIAQISQDNSQEVVETPLSPIFNRINSPARR